MVSHCWGTAIKADAEGPSVTPLVPLTALCSLLLALTPPWGGEPTHLKGLLTAPYSKQRAERGEESNREMMGEGRCLGASPLLLPPVPSAHPPHFAEVTAEQGSRHREAQPRHEGAETAPGSRDTC